jgi:YVTN family beta-propeller protein
VRRASDETTLNAAVTRVLRFHNPGESMNTNGVSNRYFGVVLAAMLILMQGCAMLSVHRTSPSNFAVAQRITIGGSGGWDFITFDPVRQRLFVARGDRVQVWSNESKRVVSEIAGTGGVHGVALAQDLQRGFTSNGRANTVTVFNLETLQVLDTISIAGDNPDAILYEPKFKRVYCFNGRSGDVTVIDAVDLKVLANIALGGKPEVGVSDGAGHVFVNIQDRSELVVIDQVANAVQARWPLAPCTNPTGLALDATHRRLFSVCDNHKMVILDAQSGRQVAILPIGGAADGAEYDSALRTAFSPNGDGTLTLIHEDDPEHFTVAANVPTQDRARTLALDPLAHRVYLVTALFGPTPAPTDEQPKPRPPMLPDSFTVIVVAPQ